MVLAKIAVWELTEPPAVTKARIFSLSICTVSEGARSSAKISTGSERLDNSVVFPDNTEVRRSETSRISAALWRM